MLPAPSLHRALETALAVLVFGLALVAPAAAYEASVGWMPVNGTDGYKIYVRQNGGQYGTGTNVGAPTADPDGTIRFVLSNLDPRVTTYFAVTSYDAQTGSERLNEIAVGPMSLRRCQLRPPS